MTNRKAKEGGLKSEMRTEAETGVQLRYWEGRLEGLLEGTKLVDKLDKTKDKVVAEGAVHLAVEKAAASGWVEALRWVLKAAEEKASEVF